MIAYTDGSYCKRKDGNYGVGWAFIILDEYNNVIHEEYGAYNEYIESRNVGGEIYEVVRLNTNIGKKRVEKLDRISSFPSPVLLQKFLLEYFHTT